MVDPLRALIVEDDRAWQQILAELLSDAGLLVEVVESADEAIQRLRAASHRLAIVDLSLRPGDVHNQDGLLVLEALRRHDPGCVALLLTGFATVELAVEAINRYSALTCLRKEAFDRTEFYQLIQQALVHPPPIHSSSPSAIAVSHEQIAPSTHSLSVLVVEDDAGWRNILSELLVDAGYTVRLCNGYGEALGCLRRERFALAVIDLLLSGLQEAAWASSTTEPQLPDGYRLLALMRECGVPTLVVSGIARADEIEHLYARYGVFACLQKQNFDRRAFLQTIADIQAAQTADDKLGTLTERERQVLALLAQGLANKEIARILMITNNTVKRHLKAIFDKLDVHTRAAAAAKAIDAGITARPTGN